MSLDCESAGTPKSSLSFGSFKGPLHSLQGLLAIQRSTKDPASQLSSVMCVFKQVD